MLCNKNVIKISNVFMQTKCQFLQIFINLINDSFEPLRLHDNSVVKIMKKPV